jgi:hypothetical protein
MNSVFSFVITFWMGAFRSRLSLQLEIAALRNQLSLYQRSQRRPAITPGTRRAGWHRPVPDCIWRDGGLAHAHEVRKCLAGISRYRMRPRPRAIDHRWGPILYGASVRLQPRTAEGKSPPTKVSIDSELT